LKLDFSQTSEKKAHKQIRTHSAHVVHVPNIKTDLYSQWVLQTYGVLTRKITPRAVEHGKRSFATFFRHAAKFFICAGLEGLKFARRARAYAPEGTPREGARADFVAGKHARI
jgi:hypothetical protein